MTDIDRELKNIDLSQIDIHDLLPQKEPFVMIGRITDISEKTITAETVISESNIFVDNGHFSPSGLIENIAQTCAAKIGFYNKYILKSRIAIGYIGAIKNLEITDTPKVGEKIYTNVNIIEDIFGMTLANASISCNDKTIVTTEIKIAVKKTMNNGTESI